MKNTYKYYIFLVVQIYIVFITSSESFPSSEDTEEGSIIEYDYESDDDPFCAIIHPRKHGKRVVARIDEAPWTALIGIEDDSGKHFVCGGTLINQYVVVSHIDCIKDNVSYFVRLGEYDLEKEQDCEGDICAPPVQDIQVEEIEENSEFANNNGVVLILAKPIKFNGFVMPLCLHDRSEEDEEHPKLLGLTVAGWGISPKKLEPQFPVKNIAQIKFKEHSVCENPSNVLLEETLISCFEDGYEEQLAVHDFGAMTVANGYLPMTERCRWFLVFILTIWIFIPFFG